MPKPSIVGLCYQGHLPEIELRLHQSGAESFVLELGEANVALTLEQVKALPEGITDLVAYVSKRLVMSKTLLESG